MIYIKVITLSIISVIFMVFTLPPFNLSICTWIAFVPLLYLFYRPQFNKFLLILIAFSITGAVSYYFALNWILSYQKKTFIIVWPICACVFPFFGIIIWMLFKWIKNIFWQAAVIPCVWIILLKIYSLTYIGYHWGEQFLAYSQKNIYLIQLVSILGTTGLSFLILLFNASVSLAIAYKNLKSIFLLVFTNLLILAVIIYGYSRVGKRYEDGKMLKIALVQPGSSGEPGFEHVNPIFDDSQLLECMQQRIDIPRFVSLNKKAGRLDPDLIIWPQYNLPMDLTRPYRLIKQFYLDFSTPILLGTFIYQGKKIVNISLLLNQRGEVGGMRSSVLAPPFREMNQTFGKGFMPIYFYKPGLFPGFKVGSLLCYEDTTSEPAREMADRGAELLLAHVNNEVFQKTDLPIMHLRRDIFRAVENRRWFIRAATTGISAIIDPYGRIVYKTGLGEEGIKYFIIPMINKKAFFTRHGDWVWILSVILVVLAIIYPKVFHS